MAAGDDGLQVVGANDRVDEDAWAEQQGRREVAGGCQHGEQRSSAMPPGPGSREYSAPGRGGAGVAGGRTAGVTRKCVWSGLSRSSGWSSMCNPICSYAMAPLGGARLADAYRALATGGMTWIKHWAPWARSGSV